MLMLVNAEKSIKMAYEYCTNQDKRGFHGDIKHVYLTCRKIKWFKEQEVKEEKNTKLLAYLDKINAPEDMKATVEKVVESTQVEREVPDHFVCPITYQLYTDPVILSSGQTYERKPIMKYLHDHNGNDPLTNEKVGKDIIDNIMLRQSIEDFVESNPWAYNHSYKDAFMTIDFTSKPHQS